jgi:anaerobic selenocysteine-containing dehydrogenase
MPDLENTAAPAGAAAGPERGTPSRRAVLRGAAGAGAAGIAAATLGGVAAPVPAAARAQSRDLRTAPDAAAAGEGIVVHVRDAAVGQIDVFRGTTQTRLQDRDLAARLVRASR